MSDGSPSKPTYIKCKPPQMCRRLSERLDPENNRAKGLCPVVFTHAETGRRRWVGIVFKKNAADPGFILNVCPFCGEEIHVEGGIVLPSPADTGPAAP